MYSMNSLHGKVVTSQFLIKNIYSFRLRLKCDFRHKFAFSYYIPFKLFTLLITFIEKASIKTEVSNVSV